MFKKFIAYLLNKEPVELIDVAEPFNFEPKQARISEPVISLAESLQVLEDWDEQYCYASIVKLVHEKHKLVLKYDYDDFRLVGVDWMTTAEANYISTALRCRRVLESARAEAYREAANLKERERFFVLVNQG